LDLLNPLFIVSSPAWRGLSDLEALEYWDLQQVHEDREGDGRSERPADDECWQRRHGNASDR
jgi:hypothetical protein